MSRRRAIFTGHSGDGEDTGTIKLVLKDTKVLIHRMMMKVKSGVLTSDLITQVKVTLGYDINGTPSTEPIIDVTGAQLDEVNKFLKAAAMGTNSVLELLFEMFGQKSVKETYATSINMGVRSKFTGKMITTMTIEIRFAGATAPEVDFIGDIDDPSADGPGAIPRLLQFQTSTIPVMDDAQYKDLPSGSGARFYRGIFLKPASGTISLTKLSFDGSGDFHYSDKTVEQQMQTEGGRTPGAYFGHVLDFTQEGISEPLDTKAWGKPTLKITQTDPVAIIGVLASFGE